MKIIKWSPIEIVEPYSLVQLDSVLQNIKDLDKIEKRKEKEFFKEHGYNPFYKEAPECTKLIEYLQIWGSKYVALKYPNTEFFFRNKYVKGVYVVYTEPPTPPTPWDDVKVSSSGDQLDVLVFAEITEFNSIEELLSSLY